MDILSLLESNENKAILNLQYFNGVKKRGELYSQFVFFLGFGHLNLILWFIPYVLSRKFSSSSIHEHKGALVNVLVNYSLC